MVAVCKLCKSENAGKCAKKKNATVKTNKRRPCNMFEMDETKADDYMKRKMKSLMPVATFRPDWWWDKDLRKQARQEAAVVEQESHDISQFGTTVDPSYKPNVAHPLTGDLSRFTQKGNENETEENQR